jgi:hypothetical protein
MVDQYFIDIMSNIGKILEFDENKSKYNIDPPNYEKFILSLRS